MNYPSLDVWLAVLGVLGCAIVLGSHGLRLLPLSGPLLALAVGVVLGPEVLDVLALPEPRAVLHDASEVLAAIALMAVALRYRIGAVAKVAKPVGWLVALVMPGMAAVGALLATLLIGLPVAEALLLGAVLAPTDPVLSSSIVTGGPAEKVLPARLRQILSTESGANDGLAWPMVILGVVLVRDEGLGRWGIEGVVAVLLAVAGGLALGALYGYGFRELERRRDVEPSGFFMSAVVLAVFTLGVVNLLGGDGLLGVFVAGLAYNAVMGESTASAERTVEEGINRILVLPLFVLLGLVPPWRAWGDDLAALAAFAVALLLLRRLPLVLALRPVLRLERIDAAFLGWFGPVGVAALFYLTLAIQEGAAGDTAWAAGTFAIAASTVIHGVTATPGRRVYDRLVNGGGGGP